MCERKEYVGRRLLCERTDLLYIVIRYTIYETPAAAVEAAASTAPSPKAKAAGDAIDCRTPPARLPLAYVDNRFSVRRSRCARRLV